MATGAINLMKELWQLCLSCEMLALETCGVLLNLMMVVNIQTLGAPVAYAAIPGIISACSSVILITAIGAVTDRWGKTKKSKAVILSLVSCIELCGLSLVLIANVFQLRNERKQGEVVSDDYESWAQSVNQTTAIEYLQTTLSSSSSDAILSIQTLTTVTTSAFDILEEDGKIPWIAFLAMAGYTLTDCGYDTTACFIKTFVLDCTPHNLHASVLIKLVLTASFGGVISTCLGSSNIALTLTSGTNLDPNAAMCCILAGVSLVLMLVGTFTTIVTGLVWLPPTISQPILLQEDQCDIDANPHEQTRLTNKRESHINSSTLSNTHEKVKEAIIGHGSVRVSHPSPIANNCDEKERVQNRPNCTGIFQKHKNLILVNIFCFLINSAHYVFQTFNANFLGQAVFHGDPAAPKESPQYTSYLEGVAVGSQGLLISYMAATITSIFHEKIFRWLGWKLEVVIATTIHFILCFSLGFTLKLWLYYVSAVWFAPLRTVSVSVPYILANKVALGQNSDKGSDIAIASVSAMLPLGILVCSSLIGPLIDVTGDAAVSVYYTGTTALLACLITLFMKI